MTWDIIIETARHSAEKYHVAEKDMRITLKKRLPLGMIFPYNFGFIPGTKGADGDPLDAMVICEWAATPASVINCRLIGGMTAEQTEKRKTIRNDRFFFIPTDDQVFAHIKEVSDFGQEFYNQLKDFFIRYNESEGKKFKPLRQLGVMAAEKLITRSKS